MMHRPANPFPAANATTHDGSVAGEPAISRAPGCSLRAGWHWLAGRVEELENSLLGHAIGGLALMGTFIAALFIGWGLS